MQQFKELYDKLISLVDKWAVKLLELPESTITTPRNDQNRTIKEIVGHMVDSASNNTHRIVHLQYQGSPLIFPDYSNFGNNENWISIQNFQDEDWKNLVNLWTYSHLHVIHVVNNVKVSHLNNAWISALEERITLEEMILDFPRHFLLHINEIEELMEE